MSKALLRTLVLQFSVAKPKNTSDMTPVPGIKLLAFGMNHIGVLGDDAKKVIAEQATVLARQSSYSTTPQCESCAPTYPFPFTPLMLSLLMLENAVLVL